ncbi:MAG: hypothetical protein IPH78_05760 [Bacteroidetes bacterium]|nr:hypothetical protein [Bacteroidota bacterium]
MKHPWLQQRPKERMNLLFNFLQILLSRCDYDTASSLLVAELNNKELEKMLPQQYIGLRFFYLVTLYEQKKFHLMESPLRALNYAIQREDKQNKVAQELARLFSLLVKQAPALKLKQAIQKVELAVKSTPYFSNQVSGINRLIESTWYEKMYNPYR